MTEKRNLRWTSKIKTFYDKLLNRMREIIVRLLGTTVAIREMLQDSSYPEYEIDVIDGFTFDDKLIIEEVNLAAM